MCNSIRKGPNSKLLLLLQLSNNNGKMGIMGTNTISNRLLCGFNQLKRKHQSREIANRVSLINDITVCEKPGLTNYVIFEIMTFLVCY